jgi:hypothetical protein
MATGWIFQNGKRQSMVVPRSGSLIFIRCESSRIKKEYGGVEKNGRRSGLVQSLAVGAA